MIGFGADSLDPERAGKDLGSRAHTLRRCPSTSGPSMNVYSSTKAGVWTKKDQPRRAGNTTRWTPVPPLGCGCLPSRPPDREIRSLPGSPSRSLHGGPVRHLPTGNAYRLAFMRLDRWLLADWRAECDRPRWDGCTYPSLGSRVADQCTCEPQTVRVRRRGFWSAAQVRAARPR